MDNNDCSNFMNNLIDHNNNSSMINIEFDTTMHIRYLSTSTNRYRNDVTLPNPTLLLSRNMNVLSSNDSNDTTITSFPIQQESNNNTDFYIGATGIIIPNVSTGSQNDFWFVVIGTIMIMIWSVIVIWRDMKKICKFQ